MNGEIAHMRGAPYGAIIIYGNMIAPTACKGWTCPKCESVYAPHVLACASCKKTKVAKAKP